MAGAVRRFAAEHDALDVRFARQADPPFGRAVALA